MEAIIVAIGTFHGLVLACCNADDPLKQQMFAIEAEYYNLYLFNHDPETNWNIFNLLWSRGYRTVYDTMTHNLSSQCL
jgi:hypothetical protein